MGTFAGVRKLDKAEWTPMMEQALNVIYFLAEHPEKITENLIKKIAACLLDKITLDKASPEQEQGSQDKHNGKLKIPETLLCGMFVNNTLESAQVLNSFSYSVLFVVFSYSKPLIYLKTIALILHT